MASGERITVTYAHPNRHEGGEALKLDVYAFVPPVDPVDPTPTFSSQNRLPFLLFLHGGFFLSGGRRDVPPWLASLARDNGIPLLAADYRLAPHAGPSDSLDDLKALWQFITNDLNWIIACSGNGAEVESGNEMLEQDFSELQRRGGIDVDRGIICSVGSGGFLTAIGGAILSPPPIALVMGYPLLEIGRAGPESPGYFVPANTPGHLRPLLEPSHVGRAAMAKSSVPDVPMVLEKAPYAMDMRARCGMDVREPWKGKEESVRRQGVTDFLLKGDRLNTLLRHASPNMITPEELLLNQDNAGGKAPRNRPYPPTLIFHGLRDSRISPESSKHFIDVIRTAEPVAAAMDTLASGIPIRRRNVPQAELAAEQEEGNETGAVVDNTLALTTVPSNPNVTSRYLFLGIDGPGAGHAFDALLPRELRQSPFSRVSPKMISDRYRASLVHVERWIRHWLLEGSAERAAAQKASQKEEQRKQQDRKANDHDASSAAPNSEQEDPIEKRLQESKEGGARVRIPLRGPRL